MNNITVQQEKYTLQLAVHTGDSFALMSAHKKFTNTIFYLADWQQGRKI